jgi:two-component system OmpR family sensor kinase
MSIRLRLTLLYTAILALTVIAFSAILYSTQTRTTYAGIRANLVRQASFFGEPRAPDERAPEEFSDREEPPPGEPRDMQLPSGTLFGRWTQTRSIDGEVTGRTLDLSDATLPLSAKGLQAAQAGEGWFETATVQDEPLLIYSQLAAQPASEPVIVQVAFPIDQPQQYLSTLRLMLIAGSSLAVLVAFGLGWALAGTALSPIQRITQTAQTIGAERNFARRVAHDGPSDEVGQLALTFNDMLAELESGYRQLESSLQSQRRFVADASHELRTPLTTVRGNIELLRRRPPVDASEQAEILADTTEEVDRLIRLVNQLLVLARVDAGQALRRDALTLAGLLEDVCRQARLLTPRPQINCLAPEDLTVEGDRDALKQVLLILVENALVHTPPGTAVTITASESDGTAMVRVADGGPGIAPDVLEHIFERFYRGDTSRSGRGAGLGLAIAKELVEAMDGSIAVESQPGRGAVFTVTLPLRQGALGYLIPNDAR